MQIGPIFRALTRNKIGVGLLILEIAVTVAIVLNCTSLIVYNRGRMILETGLDEENMIGIEIQSYGEEFQESAFLGQVKDQDLAMIRSQPGVIAATMIHPWPLEGGGSSNQRKPVGASDDKLLRSPRYIVGPDFLDAMGLELAEGRPFVEADVPRADPDDPDAQTPQATVAIITRKFAEKLFPEGDALGKQITGDGQNDYTIVGIIEHMYTPYDGGKSGMEYNIGFYPGRPGGASRSRYMVRTEPGAYNELFTSLEERLGASHPERNITTQSQIEIKQGGIGVSAVMVKILGAIMVLLLFVTGIGIYGLTSFSVTGRTKQIGTRRALGATRLDIVRYFLVENSLVAGIGISVGAVLAVVMNQALVNATNATPLDAGMVAGGALLIWAIGAVATLFPALRAARVPPVVATQTA